MTANLTNLPSIGLRPGDKIDKYEVIEQIGAGGFSVVWKAYDRLLDKHVAVKQVTVDSAIDADSFRERFRSEAVIQKKAAQEHKNLVRIIEFVEDPRGLFIIMEYVNGPSLEHLLAQNPGPVDIKTALGIAAAAAVALGAIHDKGIVHRDLKPANVLLPNEGGLKICDFGLAALMVDQEMPSVGTVRYMSPELLDGKVVDGRADLYSLGFMLYEMLIGRANFDDAFKIVLRDQRNVALRWMKWHTNLKVKAPPIRQYVPAVPEPIAQLVERMIEKDPNQRIASASQLIEAMRRQLSGAAAAALPAATSAPLQAMPTANAVGDKTVKVAKRNKVVLIAAATIVLWSLIGVGYMVYQKNQETKKLADAEELIRSDYRAAVKHFREEKWDEAAAAFNTLLAKHPKALGMSVPVAGDKRKTLEEATQGHLLVCEARREFNLQNFNRTIELLAKATDNGSVDLNLITKLHNEADILNRIEFKEKSIQKQLAEGKFFAAKHEWLQFRSDGFYKYLSAEQQERWDRLEPMIRAQQEEKEAQTIIAQAKALEINDRAGAIGILEEWKAKNTDNPNRMVDAYIAALKGAVDFETAVARGKSAEQRMEFPLAITSYESALARNRKAGEEMGLPSQINRIKGRVAFLAGKTAFEANDVDEAIRLLNEALSYIPKMAEAEAILKQIDSAGQMASLRRSAVAAFESKEYEKSINLWKRLRDEFGEDTAKVTEEITKAEFQIAVKKMDDAWNSEDGDAATLTAIDGVLAMQPEYARATTLKTLIETRRRIRTLVAAGDALRAKGEYGDSKRELRRAQDIAKTITDATIREQLLTEATKHLDEVEYLDFFNKAKRDFELKKYDTARANILAAIRMKKTDEAKALHDKIQVEYDKKQVNE